MHAVRALSLLFCLTSTAMAQDEVKLGFNWADGATWRLVVQWELDITDPKGATTERSGVVREVWSWDERDQEQVLTVSDTLNVRATPRDDVLAQRIGATWASERIVQVRPDEEAEAPMMPEEVAAEPAAGSTSADGTTSEVASEAGTEQAADGSPEATPAEGASDPTPAAPPAEVAPEEAVTDKPAAPVHMVPDLVMLVTARLEHGVVNLLERLDGTKMTVGQEAYFTVAAGKEVWKMKRLANCPDVGPGSSCVELSMKRYLAGATTDGAALEPGQGRFEATWVLEPSTLVIHGAHIAGTVAYHDGTGDKEGTWLASVSRDLTFLDLQPPAELPIQ